MDKSLSPPSSTKPNNGSSTNPSLTFISYLRRLPPTPGMNLSPFTARHPPFLTHCTFNPLPKRSQPTNNLTLNALPQNPNPLPKLQPYNSNTFRLNHYILTSSTAYLLILTLNVESHSHQNTPLTTPPYATLYPTIHHLCSYNDSSDPPPLSHLRLQHLQHHIQQS